MARHWTQADALGVGVPKTYVTLNQILDLSWPQMMWLKLTRPAEVRHFQRRTLWAYDRQTDVWQWIGRFWIDLVSSP